VGSLPLTTRESGRPSYEASFPVAFSRLCPADVFSVADDLFLVPLSSLYFRWADSRRCAASIGSAVAGAGATAALRSGSYSRAISPLFVFSPVSSIWRRAALALCLPSPRSRSRSNIVSLSLFLGSVLTQDQANRTRAALISGNLDLWHAGVIDWGDTPDEAEEPMALYEVGRRSLYPCFAAYSPINIYLLLIPSLVCFVFLACKYCSSPFDTIPCYLPRWWRSQPTDAPRPRHPPFLPFVWYFLNTPSCVFCARLFDFVASVRLHCALTLSSSLHCVLLKVEPTGHGPLCIR
jgi:hypothetical protein